MDALKEQYKDDPKNSEEETNKLLAANPLPATPLSVLFDHFDHVAKVAGVDHVGIGSDFDGIEVCRWAWKTFRSCRILLMNF